MNVWEIVIFIIILIILIALLLITFALIYPYTYKWEDIKKKKRKTITLENLKKQGKSGDLLLFSGNDRLLISSDIRKLVFGTEFTHVGLLYMKDSIPYVWESATLYEDRKNKKDTLTGKLKEGPQLKDLEDVLKGYDGYVVYLPIYPSLEETHSREKVEKEFQKAFKKYKNYEFDHSCWLGIVSVYHMFGLPISDDGFDFLKKISAPQTITCPEIVVDMYKKFRIWDKISPKIPIKAYFPHNFRMKGYLGNRKCSGEYEIIL